MSETGLILFLVPVGYGIAFFTLLLAAVVVAFVRKWTFLGAYFVAGAVAAIPAFGVWAACHYCFANLAKLTSMKNWSFAGIADPVELLLILASFCAGIGCFGSGVFLSARMVFRGRRSKRARA